MLFMACHFVQWHLGIKTDQDISRYISTNPQWHPGEISLKWEGG